MEATRQTQKNFILSLILGIILENVTNTFINYNVLTEIMSLVLYSAIISFIITDIYCLKKHDYLYHKFSLIRYLIILISLVLIFYILANMSNIKLLVIGMGVLAILTYLTRKFSVKANEYNTFKFDERD